MNYFQIFGLPAQFDIDLKDLQDGYLKLQKKYHPDLANSEEQKLEYVMQTADLNNGYLTLKNPYLRAAHILKLNNIDIISEGKNNFKIPDEFLATILEKRENLEEIENYESLLSLEKGENLEREKIYNQLTENFSTKDFKKAAILTMLLKYQDNLINIIDQKIEKC